EQLRAEGLAATSEGTEPADLPVVDLDQPVPWPIDQEALTTARIAILETRAEKDRRQVLTQQIIRGTCKKVVHLRFEDTPILYARQFLFDLLG
ncbi:MAG: hypothetical protein GX153_04205, partial [Clostridiaceae bacterium]|nr:hypothetical protein [Clostridiaceae bacterium]